VEQAVGMAPGAGEDAACAICRQYVHLAAVECDCCPGRRTCLRHAATLCECPPARWRLAFRHALGELDALAADAAARVPAGAALESPNPKLVGYGWCAERSGRARAACGRRGHGGERGAAPVSGQAPAPPAAVHAGQVQGVGCASTSRTGRCWSTLCHTAVAAPACVSAMQRGMGLCSRRSAAAPLTPGTAPAGFEAELEAAAAGAPPAAAAAPAKPEAGDADGGARAGGPGPARAPGGAPRAPPTDAAAPSPAPEEKPPLTAKAAKAGKAGRKCAYTDHFLD